MTLVSTWATTKKDFNGGDGGLSGDVVLTYSVAASTSLKKGNILYLDTGYVKAVDHVSNKVPIGVALEDVDNSSGSAGDKVISVKVRGIVQVNARINHTGTYDDALVPFTKCGLSTDGVTAGQFVSCGADPAVYIGKMLSTQALAAGSISRRALIYIDLLGVPDQA